MISAVPQYVLQSWPTFRQWERAPLDSRVTVKVGPAAYRGWCENIGRGGLGFTCAAPLRPGDEVGIEIDSEILGCIEVRAIVRHTVAFHSGCEFVFISPLEQQMIAQYVRVRERVKLR